MYLQSCMIQLNTAYEHTKDHILELRRHILKTLIDHRSYKNNLIFHILIL